jgi:gliding motility-associated-like protein
MQVSFSQTTIYEDLFTNPNSNSDGTATTTTAFTSGAVPNNTNWRYTEFDSGWGISWLWDTGADEAVLQNTFGVNEDVGCNMLYKAGNNYYTAPGGLYEQTTNFTTVLTNNIGIVEWTINFRSPNEVPQGLTNGNAGFTGGAFVLGLDSPTLQACTYTTVGYALVFGDASGSGNYVKLVKVNGGTTDNNCATNNQPKYTFFNWNGTNTTSCIISDNQNLTTGWYSVKVQFNPANDEWRLFVRNDGGSKGDPQTLNDTHCKGANVDATYTGINLPIMGLYACLPLDGGQLRSVRFDNLRLKINVPQLGCPSTTSLCGAYSICNNPVINTQPSSQAICASGNTNISVTTTPASGPFQWQFFNGSSWVNVSNGTPLGFAYSNQTSSTLGISTSNADCGDYQFRVVAGSSGCSVNSNSAIISVIKAERIAPTGQQCSDTQLNFNSCPTGATYSWTVTSPSGTSATPIAGSGQTFSFTPTNNSGSSQTFNVVASVIYQGLTCPFTFTPTIISPPQAGDLIGASDLCVGNTLNLTNSGNSGGTWASSNTSVATVNSSGVVSGIGVGNTTISYTLSATTPCTGSDEATASISVFDGLDAGVLSTNNETLCVGNTTVINTTGNSGGTWASSDNNIATIDANGLLTGVGPGTVTITYSVSSSSCGGSSESSTITITINTGSNAGSITGDNSLCEGETTLLTSDGEPGGIWTSSNPSIATINSSGLVTALSSGNVVITYTINSSSCSGQSDQSTYSIVVNDGPDAGTLVGLSNLCQGETGSISSSGDQVGIWSSSNTSVLTVNSNGDLAAIGSGSATITYTVSASPVGCSNTLASSESSINIVVNPQPTVTVNNATICPGGTANLIATPTINGGSYNWTPGGQISNSINVSPVVNSTYNVIYTVNGCSSPSASAVVTVNQPPPISFTADQTSGCAPLTVTLTSSSNTGDCVWNLGNGQSINGCVASYTFEQGGCYDISLSSLNNGCESISTVDDFVCIENPPIASFVVNPTVFNEPSDLVSFYNTSVGASSYLWIYGDGQSSNLENPSHYYLNTTNGVNIQLIAISAAGCVDTTIVVIPYQESEVFYVPNSFTPDEDEHNQIFSPVFTSGFDPFNFQMLIFDRWGELVFESYDAKVGWDGTYGLNGTKAPDGTYTWKISFKSLFNDKRKLVVGHVTLLR